LSIVLAAGVLATVVVGPRVYRVLAPRLRAPSAESLFKPTPAQLAGLTLKPVGMASFNDQRSADSVQANASRLADTAAFSRSLAGGGTGRMFTSATMAAKIWRGCLGFAKIEIM
jgi:hypothetical protein